MGVVIRDLVAADRAVVLQMLESCGAFTAEEVSVAVDVLDDALRRPRADYVAFAAECDARVCGYLCVGKTPMTASTWHLYWVCVDRGAQRSGVGRALHAHAEAWVRSQDGSRLVLETSSQPGYERVHRFYAAAGYRQVGRIADFYQPNDDCIFYCKELV